MTNIIDKKKILFLGGVLSVFLLVGMLLNDANTTPISEIPEELEEDIDLMEEEPKTSDLTPPIFINGTAKGIGAQNWSWAVEQEWCYGEGTHDNPYKIKNLTIDAGGSGSAIAIVNSRAFFEIENCTLYNAGPNLGDSGIVLNNATRGYITSNNCTNNPGNGITLAFSSNNNTIFNNSVTGSQYGIVGYISSNNTISKNWVWSCESSNIFFTTNSMNNSITLNHLYSASDSGIHIDANCNYNLIKNNTLKYNDIGVKVRGTNNTIKNNLFIDTENTGIEFNNAYNNTARNNTMVNVRYVGIYARKSNLIFIINNSIDNTYFYEENEYKPFGIEVDQSNYTYILRNNIKGSFKGMYVHGNVQGEGWECSDNLMWRNNISNCRHGINLAKTRNSTLVENEFKNCSIFIEAPSINEEYVARKEMIKTYFSYDISETNLVNDKPIYYYHSAVNLTTKNNFTSVGDPGQIILVNCSDSIINDVNISHGTSGIQLFYCLNVSILDVNASYHNIVSIYLDNCLNNTLDRNIMKGSGIILADANNVEIDISEITSHNITSDNLINGKPLYYYANKTNLSNNNFTGGAGEIILANCHNSTIESLKINASSRAFSLYFCSNITVKEIEAHNHQIVAFRDYNGINNTFSNNDAINNGEGFAILSCVNTSLKDNYITNNIYSGVVSLSGQNITLDSNHLEYNFHGITVSSGESMTIFRNWILHNEFGIWAGGSRYNKIYNNTFIDNTIQVEDNGEWTKYDNGTIGNYWSDYDGYDDNDDGIGDFPYLIYDINSVNVFNDTRPRWNDGPFERYIDGDATGPGAQNWSWALKRPWCTGEGIQGDPYVISGLDIDADGDGYGLFINNSNVPVIIDNCNFTNSGSSDAGIVLENCQNINITNCNSSYNLGHGISLDNCDNNVIINCTLNNNGEDFENGIDLYYSDNNLILNNTITSNAFFGIKMFQSNNNDIFNNTITSHSSFGGIFLRENCDLNTIKFNNITNNKNGIQFERIISMFDDNVISYNEISENNEGIHFTSQTDCDGIDIYSNQINDNTNYGISGGRSIQNARIIGNILDRNGIGIDLSVSSSIIAFNYIDGQLDAIQIDTVGSEGLTWAEAADYDIYEGTGIQGDPYIIEDLQINAQGIGSCITIVDSSAYLRIDNCSVINAGSEGSNAGILIEGSSNINITNCNSSNNGNYGIFGDQCSNILIENCTCSFNAERGIDLSNCQDMKIVNNTLKGTSVYSIFLGGTTNSIIRNNTIYGVLSGDEGISIREGCSDTLIYWNEVHNCDTGIYYQCDNTYIYVNTLIGNNDAIENNNPSDCKEMANYIDYKYYTSFIIDDGTNGLDWADFQYYARFPGSGTFEEPYIIQDVIVNASDSGSAIFIDGSDGIYFIIRNCTCIRSGTNTLADSGIRLNDVHDGWIINNNCSNNGENGMTLDSCTNMTLSFNNITNNDNIGIYLRDAANDNRIFDNHILSNEKGIFLDSICDDNNITNNIVLESSVYGVHLSGSSRNNVSLNQIINSEYIGIYIYYSDFNIICRNSFNGSNDGVGCSGIDVRYSEDNVVCWNNITDNYYGIYLAAGSSSNNFTHNNISYNYRGIFIQEGTPCHYNDIINNTISYNTNEGIMVCKSNYTDIIDNDINFNSIGISLDSSNETVVINNQLVGNGQGIVYDNCQGNSYFNQIDGAWTFSSLTIDNNGEDGLTWEEAAAYDWCSGDGSWEDPYTIENIIFNAQGTGSGLTIKNSIGVYFIIRNCTFINSGSEVGNHDAGIEIESSDNGMLINNNCTDNNNHGMYLIWCDNLTISWNNVSNNAQNGINLVDCDQSRIHGNKIQQNIVHGLYLASNSDYNNITFNNASLNGQDGIFVTYSYNNNISKNIIFDNDEVGIYLENSDENDIYGNCIVDNEQGAEAGIKFQNSDKNGIYYNNISYNYYGIYFQGGCFQNEIYFNNISYNTMNGIYMTKTAFSCDNNRIYGNNITYNVRNGIFIFDASNNNITENFIYENYWSGIELELCLECNVINNTIELNDDYGIYLDSTNESKFFTNDLISNGFGFVITNCKENVFMMNKIDGMYDSLIINEDGSEGYKWEEATAFDWCSGDGSWDNPYTLQNLVFYAQGSGSGMIIKNSQGIYFIIQNCTYHGFEGESQAGIKLDNTDNGRLINNNFTSCEQGIYLNNCDNNTIQANNITQSTIAGIYLYESDNNTLFKNNLTYSGHGIKMEFSDYNNLSKNVIFNTTSGYCIRLYYSDHNNCSKNILKEGKNGGINLAHSLNNTINFNYVNGCANTAGLYLYGSCNNTIISNNITQNYRGIYLRSFSQSNRFLGNNISYNTLQGIISWSPPLSCHYNKFINNYISHNGDDGIQMHWADHLLIKDNRIIDNQGIGIYINSGSYCKVINNTILQNINSGFYGQYSYYCNLSRNNISNNIRGIFLYRTEHYTIGNNIIECNDRDGIVISESSYTKITFNQIIENKWCGIDIHTISNYNNLTKNVIYLSGYDNNEDGIQISDNCNYTLISYNNISFSKNHGILLDNAHFSTIYFNRIYNNTQDGVYLDKATFNNITENFIENNTNGINFDDSSNNEIHKNNITDNKETGIYIQLTSIDNLIYRNNFSRNWAHAIDLGSNNEWNSPSIGNFWDNYTGIDNDFDGLGDKPHVFNGGIDYKPICFLTGMNLEIHLPENYSHFNSLWQLNVSLEQGERTMDCLWYNVTVGAKIYFINLTAYNNTQIAFNDTIWEELPQGAFYVYFYANDTAGALLVRKILLLYKDTVLPSITINYPDDGSKFTNAPTINATINEMYLEDFWYQIEGSATKYGLNNNTETSIDSAVWEDLDYGEYKIYFYATDEAGNVYNTYLTISKVEPSSPAPSPTPETPQLYWILDPFIIDNLGTGDYTWTQAVNQPWCSGSGTAEDPYIIENVTIKWEEGDSYYCIMIRNSDAYFIIRNCNFTTLVLYPNPSGLTLSADVSNNATGIFLYNTDNGQLTDNNCTGLYHGIQLYLSNSNTITGNVISKNHFGIYLMKSNNNKISGNSLSGNTQDYLATESSGNESDIGDSGGENVIITIFRDNYVIIIIIIVGSVALVGGGVLRKRTKSKKGKAPDKKELTIKQKKLPDKIQKQIKGKTLPPPSAGKKAPVEHKKAKAGAKKKGTQKVEKEEKQGLTAEERAELEKTEKEVGVQKNKVMCIVHRGAIEGSIYLCPHCQSFYCSRCAKVLKLNGERCWSCDNEINIEISDKDRRELSDSKPESKLDVSIKNTPSLEEYLESEDPIESFPQLKETLFSMIDPEHVDQIEQLKLSEEERKQFLIELISLNPGERIKLLEEMLQRETKH